MQNITGCAIGLHQPVEFFAINEYKLNYRLEMLQFLKLSKLIISLVNKVVDNYEHMFYNKGIFTWYSLAILVLWKG